MLYPKPLPLIGTHKNNETFYFSPALHDLDSLPKKNWVCLCIANGEFDRAFFDDLMFYSFSSGLLNFTGEGKYGELLHDLFDETMVMYELDGNLELDIATFWGNEEPDSLANELWNCFYVRILPDHVNEAEITVVCISLDGKDYQQQLAGYLQRFNEGWFPGE